MKYGFNFPASWQWVITTYFPYSYNKIFSLLFSMNKQLFIFKYYTTLVLSHTCGTHTSIATRYVPDSFRLIVDKILLGKSCMVFVQSHTRSQSKPAWSPTGMCHKERGLVSSEMAGGVPDKCRDHSASITVKTGNLPSPLKTLHKKTCCKQSYKYIVFIFAKILFFCSVCVVFAKIC